MKHYAIIGNPLGHSYSARYFTDLFAREGIDADYVPYALPSLDTLRELIRCRHLDGMNVTYPYKQTILPLLDAIDPVAEQVEAVNVVVCRWQENEYHLTGYNTDVTGFAEAIRPLLQTRIDIRQALVLGSGGAAQAVCYALRQMGIEPHIVSRNAERGIPYSALTKETIANHLLIVNCTPLGMAPLSDARPDIPYEAIGKSHILYDCIYNPTETLFLKKGRTQGATVCNGLTMLTEQAKAAWDIFQTNH